MDQPARKADPVHIRPAREADADVVARLTFELGYEVSEASVAVKLSRFLGQPDHAFFVAEADGLVVAWLHATKVEFVETDPFVMIAGLVVGASHRGRGIGHQLMAHAERWAAERHCSLVRLWSSSGRTAAHEFYERLGYVKVKTQFAFAKTLVPAPAEALKRLTPTIRET